MFKNHLKEHAKLTHNSGFGDSPPFSREMGQLRDALLNKPEGDKMSEENLKCPKCREKLKESDIENYDYVCLNCEENFFKCEVIR